MVLFQDMMDTVLSLSWEINSSPHDGTQSAPVLQVPSPFGLQPIWQSEVPPLPMKDNDRDGVGDRDGDGDTTVAPLPRCSQSLSPLEGTFGGFQQLNVLQS